MIIYIFFIDIFDEPQENSLRKTSNNLKIELQFVQKLIESIFPYLHVIVFTFYNAILIARTIKTADYRVIHSNREQVIMIYYPKINI